MPQHPSTKKSLGQHFLKDGNMIRKIVDAIPAKPADFIVEIGPGSGALTDVLVKQYEDVCVVEIDKRMADYLREKHPGLRIMQEDILKTNWQGITNGKEVIHVVGNLPYYITSQILFSILEHRQKLASAILMMQKEVAERIVASPQTKEYGILSVQTQLMATPEILFDVPPQVFSPPPAVQSAVLKLTFDKPPLACSDQNLKTVVRMAFNQRRKKLRNALKRLDTELPLDTFNFDLRAEALEPAEYEKLTTHLEKMGVFD